MLATLATGRPLELDENVKDVYKIKVFYEELQPAGRTARKRAARKALILEAALSVVAADGLDALTVQRLATALDYTPGALYRYFPSKGALVAELQGFAIEAMRRQLAERFDVWSARARELAAAPRSLAPLVGAARFYADMREALPAQLHLISATVADPRVLVADDEIERVALPFTRVLAQVAQWFAAAAAAGGLAAGDARERTVVFWSALQGVVQLDKLSRIDPALFDVGALAASVATTLLTGWGAAPADVDAARAALASGSTPRLQ